MMGRFFRFMGPLRALLVIATVVVILSAPFAGGVEYRDWRLLPTVIAPTFMMLLVFVLPLDFTMTRVFMTGASGEDRARYRRILWIEAALFVGMLAAWFPFAYRLISASTPF